MGAQARCGVVFCAAFNPSPSKPIELLRPMFCFVSHSSRRSLFFLWLASCALLCYLLLLLVFLFTLQVSSFSRLCCSSAHALLAFAVLDSLERFSCVSCLIFFGLLYLNSHRVPSRVFSFGSTILLPLHYFSSCVLRCLFLLALLYSVFRFTRPLAPILARSPCLRLCCFYICYGAL